MARGRPGAQSGLVAVVVAMRQPPLDEAEHGQD
jgi:hypothetical protein